MANELGVKIEDEIFTKVKLSSLFPRPVDENKWGAFMGEFKTNFVLPNYIGVGNGITRGFGTIYGLFNPDTFSFNEQELNKDVSDKTIPQATETFNEAILPVIGILKFTSEAFINCKSTPSSSLPIIKALGPVVSNSFINVFDFSVQAYTFSPQPFKKPIKQNYHKPLLFMFVLKSQSTLECFKALFPKHTRLELESPIIYHQQPENSNK